MSSYSATTGYASNGLNREMIKRINMDGADAYYLKGNTVGVTANSDTFDPGQQDKFLEGARQHHHEMEIQRLNDLRSAAKAGGYQR